MSARAVALLLACALTGRSEAQSLKPPPGSPPGITVSMDPASPEEMTEPNSTVDCDVETLDGRKHSFTLHHSGERGYRDPATGKTETTEGKVAVVRDPARLFAGYGGWRSFDHRFEASSDREDAVFGSQVQLDLHRTDFDREAVGPTKWAILVEAYMGWMPLVKAVGFCRSESAPQQPLSDAEIRELLKSR